MRRALALFALALSACGGRVVLDHGEGGGGAEPVMPAASAPICHGCCTGEPGDCSPTVNACWTGACSPTFGRCMVKPNCVGN